MAVIKRALLLLILPALCFASREKRKTWTLTTLEWPPFVCSNCPENGAAAKALRETLRKVGVDVKFSFHSWSKSMSLGEEEGYVGYFPAWIEEVKPGFTASSTLFTSPVGFVEPRNKPLVWHSLTDLKGKVIGISQNYGNTVEFNRLVREGVIRVEVVESDDTNLRKVALGRLDGALMDINNARYFLSVNLRNLMGRVSINSKVLENKTLHLAFNGHNKDKAAKMEAALKQSNFQKIVDEYLKKYTRL